VRIAGRAEVPGRPLLYETTQVFLQHFGLRSLDELPNVEELRRVRLPSSTPPTTGDLFSPEALHPPEPDEEPEAPSALPPAGEFALTEPNAESVPAETPSTEDHAADPHP